MEEGSERAPVECREDRKGNKSPTIQCSVFDCPVAFTALSCLYRPEVPEVIQTQNGVLQVEILSCKGMPNRETYMSCVMEDNWSAGLQQLTFTWRLRALVPQTCTVVKEAGGLVSLNFPAELKRAELSLVCSLYQSNCAIRILWDTQNGRMWGARDGAHLDNVVLCVFWTVAAEGQKKKEDVSTFGQSVANRFFQLLLIYTHIIVSPGM